MVQSFSKYFLSRTKKQCEKCSEFSSLLTLLIKTDKTFNWFNIMRSRKRKPQKRLEIECCHEGVQELEQKFLKYKHQDNSRPPDNHLKERITPIVVSLRSYKSIWVFRESYTCEMFLTFHQKTDVMTSL